MLEASRKKEKETKPGPAKDAAQKAIMGSDVAALLQRSVGAAAHSVSTSSTALNEDKDKDSSGRSTGKHTRLENMFLKQFW